MRPSGSSTSSPRRPGRRTDPASITIRTVTERLPNGRTTEKRVLHMDPEVSELVRAAEQAELAAVKDALDEPKP